MKVALIPEPQKVEVGKGFLDLPLKGTIGIADVALFGVAEEVQPLFQHYSIGIAASSAPTLVNISIKDDVKNDGYRLKINKTGVFIDAVSVAMAFHAVQTLWQIGLQSPPGKLPILTIDDWSDLQDRGVYYDICRGRVPKLERLFEMVDLLSQYKINHFQLYIEHTFRFRGHPDIWKGASPLTADDLLCLDAYCRERHVEMVPSFATFGHMATVLKHKQYHNLAEDMGVCRYLDPEKKDLALAWRSAWSLAPANPKVYDFLDELFSEFLPLFSSNQFNICCDETYDLGLGQSYEMCKKKGKGRLYLDHILKVRELAAKYGKRVMFWGDIIRKYPELIKDIPKDVAVLDWGYEHNHPFSRISDFKKAGLQFFGCPGTSSWCSLFPRLSKGMDSIAGFASAAKRNGAR
ncbi:MAG: family 20 glycosylhydrolase, partial [Kiritimatiellae bacterium]|nr:family 20 glycosylhydrolase [Kiritimatiellia bacterium]